MKRRLFPDGKPIPYAKSTVLLSALCYEKNPVHDDSGESLAMLASIDNASKKTQKAQTNRPFALKTIANTPSNQLCPPLDAMHFAFRTSLPPIYDQEKCLAMGIYKIRKNKQKRKCIKSFSE